MVVFATILLPLTGVKFFNVPKDFAFIKALLFNFYCMLIDINKKKRINHDDIKSNSIN